MAIPLLSIIYSFCVGYSLLIYLKLSPAHQKTKDLNVYYFRKASFFAMTTMALVSTPGIIFSNLKAIGLVFAVYPFCGLLALAYFTSIPLSLLRWGALRKIFLGIILVISLLITILNLWNLRPAKVILEAPFIFWEDNRGLIVNMIIGVTMIILSLSSVILLVVYGFRTTNKFFKARSLLLAGGMFFYLLGFFSNFILSYYLPRRYMGALLSGLLFSAAFSFLLLSVMVKKAKSKEEAKGE